VRTPAQASQRRRKAAVVSFPAPTKGWVSNVNIAQDMTGQPAATVLDNFWPRAQSVSIRQGCAEYVTLPGMGDIQALMTYRNDTKEQLFAATQTAIYDITSASSPVQVVGALTSGAWSFTQFSTTGGTFLVAVNGSDVLRLYDGTTWWQIDQQDVLELTITSAGTGIQPGDVVTGGTSGATAAVQMVSGSNIYASAMNGKTFTSGETITTPAGVSAALSADSSVYWVAIKGPDGFEIDTTEFSFVFSYMARLFFIQRNSLSFWYLDIDSVGGTATEFPLGGVFPAGGTLMLGSSWSLDNAGTGGLSEQCVFITDEGEVAVYQGTDPNLSATWGKVGLYRIDRPRGPNAACRNGGDLLIATDTGLIPLSQAINRSISNLAPAAVSYAIDVDWHNYALTRSSRNWSMTIWPEQAMLAIALPHLDGEEDAFLVSNTRTGAWARFTGWNGTCLAVFGGQLYYGASNGLIVAALQTGYDLGAPFTATYIPLFTDGGGAEALKMPKDARMMIRGSYPISWRISMQYDYVLNIPAAPAANAADNSNLWNTGVWDSAIWSAGQGLQSQKLWTPVAGSGYAFAPCLQITSGSLVPFDNELLRCEVTFLSGGLLS